MCEPTGTTRTLARVEHTIIARPHIWRGMPRRRLLALEAQGSQDFLSPPSSLLLVRASSGKRKEGGEFNNSIPFQEVQSDQNYNHPGPEELQDKMLPRKKQTLRLKQKKQITGMLRC
ncbi:hypothetical protein CSUB01_04502 [Colletotrichum sublineola]|uniref:Uncharacterized protein n=1 Tax=Colletotrichum sublineola TaxID=1173701 RepID=A0A066X0L3_COLSU|nr:hypothetical protein CSUB01_04502 [Colletotrichum sublineola]